MFEMLAAATGLVIVYAGLRFAQHQQRLHDDPQYRHTIAIRERQRQVEQRARDLEYLAACGDNEHIRRAALVALDRGASAVVDEAPRQAAN